MSEYKKYIIIKKVDLPDEQKYHGLSKDAEYKHLYTLDSLGFPSGAVELTDEEKDLVERLPQVAEVLPDEDVTLPTPIESDDVNEEGVRALDQIRATEAHQKGFRGEGVIISILDTGLDQRHAETTVKDNFVEARSFVGDGTWHDRSSGHGTWCIGAVCSPQYGVAPKAKLLVGKVLGDNGSGSTSGIIQGIAWSVERGAKVISMSLGGSGGPNDAMSRAVDAARERGVITVAAAGNDQRGTNALTADVHSPGAARTAMTSAALNTADQLAPFSSWGKCVDIAGPGWNIEGLGLNGATGRFMSGTSMSTPHNAGGVALGFQKNPDATKVEVAIYTTARKLDYDPVKIGHGVMDINAAIDALAGSPVPEPAPPAPEPTPPTNPPERYFPDLPRVPVYRFARGADDKECVITKRQAEVGHFEPKA